MVADAGTRGGGAPLLGGWSGEAVVGADSELPFVATFNEVRRAAQAT